jgi:hypothetical protein
VLGPTEIAPPLAVVVADLFLIAITGVILLFCIPRFVMILSRTKPPIAELVLGFKEKLIYCYKKFYIYYEY